VVFTTAITNRWYKILKHDRSVDELGKHQRDLTKRELKAEDAHHAYESIEEPPLKTGC